MARDVHALSKNSVISASARGHDIGLMVAYAYAAQYPAQVERIALLDAFLPGVGDWTKVWLLRDLWHFHFYGETPLKLVTGRERIYLEHFWNDFAADRTKSVSAARSPVLRRDLRAGRAIWPLAIEVFRAFEQGRGRICRRFAKTPLCHADAGPDGREGVRRIS